jgi:predicted PurR-regulated permease PerM
MVDHKTAGYVTPLLLAGFLIARENPVSARLTRRLFDSFFEAITTTKTLR